jgi:hypothetical protein
MNQGTPSGRSRSAALYYNNLPFMYNKWLIFLTVGTEKFNALLSAEQRGR